MIDTFSFSIAPHTQEETIGCADRRRGTEASPRLVTGSSSDGLTGRMEGAERTTEGSRAFVDLR